jgi:polyisoprenoid-binding protein YceI
MHIFDVVTLLIIYYLFMKHYMSNLLKKSATVLALIIAIASSSMGQAKWKVDPNHAKLTFTVTHLGISDVFGLFKDFDATINTSKADFSDAVFQLTAKTASINTEVEKRDAHLRSPDFFDVEKNPEMTFKSTSIKKTGTNKYKLTGDLTLSGITKPVTLDLWYRGTIDNPMSKTPTAGFQLSGSIKRSDYHFGSKFPAPMLSDEVKIRADGEFLLEK